MSFSYEGLDAKVESQTVSTFISKEEPLLKLASCICWNTLSDLVLPDLKRTTTKGFWWKGRRAETSPGFSIRIHLSVMIIQLLFKLTDRRAEELVTQIPIYRVFCGHGSIKRWFCPDHTK